MKPLRLLAFTLGLSLLSVPPTHAQQDPSPSKKLADEGTLLAYVDDDGRIHVVNSIEMIPQRFRSRARPAKLGEVSTISPSSSPNKRRQQDRPRRTRSTANQQTKASDKPTAASEPNEKIETREEALLRLRKRRKEVVDQLGLLDEGWIKESSRKEPSDAELETRSEELSKELEGLDRTIAKLESSR
jgi:hypothetical protein